jgi:hypothetical protein
MSTREEKEFEEAQKEAYAAGNVARDEAATEIIREEKENVAKELSKAKEAKRLDRLQRLMQIHKYTLKREVHGHICTLCIRSL